MELTFCKTMRNLLKNHWTCFKIQVVSVSVSNAKRNRLLSFWWHKYLPLIPTKVGKILKVKNGERTEEFKKSWILSYNIILVPECKVYHFLICFEWNFLLPILFPITLYFCHLFSGLLYIFKNPTEFVDWFTWENKNTPLE